MMDKNEIKKRMQQILVNNGFYSNENSADFLLDLDSLQYVSFIVDLERDFEIAIPDEYVNRDTVGTLTQFVDMIAGLLEAKNEMNKL
jgi:acyl carrier protein